MLNNLSQWLTSLLRIFKAAWKWRYCDPGSKVRLLSRDNRQLSNWVTNTETGLRKKTEIGWNTKGNILWKTWHGKNYPSIFNTHLCQLTWIPAESGPPAKLCSCYALVLWSPDKTKLLLPALQIICFLKGPKVRPNMV